MPKERLKEEGSKERLKEEGSKGGSRRKVPKDISGTFSATARIWRCQILNLGFLYSYLGLR